LGSQTEQEHGLELFENRELEVIFGPNRNKVIERWKKLYKRNVSICSLHYIIMEPKSRRMRWAGCVACMGWMQS
jgi:hypothetical protein